MKYFTATGEDRQLNKRACQQLRGSFIGLSDGFTHYELRGPDDGDIVVLVPGLTVPLFFWDELADALHARGLQTLAYSAYGRGYSERIQDRYDELLFDRQLREIVAELDLPAPRHVVGSSMGALIAMGYVVENPSAVATLTLMGPAGLTSTRPAQRWLLRSDLLTTLVAKRFGRRVLFDHIDHNVSEQAVLGQLSEMTAECYRYDGSMYALFSTLQNYPLSARDELFRATGDCGVPTMLLWGKHDRVTPLDGMDTARALLRPAVSQLLECGHMAALERPADVARHIATFTAGQTNWTPT